MNELNIKQPYMAPDARRTRVRPVSPVRARRHPEGTWKYRAQAALQGPVEAQRGPVTLEALRYEPGEPVLARVNHDWQLRQVIAPAVITVCVIAQLAQSVR